MHLRSAERSCHPMVRERPREVATQRGHHDRKGTPSQIHKLNTSAKICMLVYVYHANTNAHARGYATTIHVKLVTPLLPSPPDLATD